MKKILFIVLIFFTLLAILFLVFVLTFDANKYKGILLEKIESAINKDVKIDNISLSIFPGLGLKITGLSIKDIDKKWRDAFLEISSMDVCIGILPLMKKDVAIRRLFIKKLYLQLPDILPRKYQIEDINLKAEKIDKDLVIHRLTGILADGYFSIKGTIKDIFGSQDSVFEIKMKDIKLNELLQDVLPGKPYIEGILSMDVTSLTKGCNHTKIFNSLSLEGNLKLDKAILQHMNILRVALDKLNMLPGIVPVLENKMPEYYREVLSQDYTIFKPIQTHFNMENGQLFLKDFVIESEAFYLYNNGYLSVRGDIDIDSNLFISTDISAILMGIVKELKYLQNDKGLITMPIYIKGRFPEISIMPDLNYVLGRLAISKGQELLKGLFRKEGHDTKIDSEEGIGKGDGEDKGPAEVIIKTLFDIINTKKD